MALTVFRRLDRDGSGSLSRKEFEAGLSFDRINTNHDSSISQAEFIRAIVSARRGGAHVAAASSSASASASSSSSSSSISLGPQYMLLAAKVGIPFIAFGFVDNIIMIAAGDHIESSVGHALALSTLCAAGLGNLMSDVVGIVATEGIERATIALGLPSPSLTPKQLMAPLARRITLLAQVRLCHGHISLYT